MPTATATDPPPAISSIIHIRLAPKIQTKWKKQKKNHKKLKKYILSLQANISNMSFNQNSPEVGVLNCHRQTNGQTNKHCDTMAESV